jgi:hypothetical protein
MSEHDIQATSAALIEASRVLDQPCAQDRERVRARIAHAIAAGGAAPASGPAADGGGSKGPGAASSGGAGHFGLATLAGHALLVMVLSAGVTAAVISVRHVTKSATRAGTQPANQRGAVAQKPASAVPVEPSPEQAGATAAVRFAAAESPPAAVSGTSSTTAKPDRRPAHRVHVPAPEVQHRLPLANPTPAPSEAPVVPPSAAPPNAARAGSPAPSLSGELALLSAAQRALAVSDLGRALTLLDQHASRYPEGKLTQERLAARAATLCRMGRRAEGARELEQLRSRSSQSPLLAWAAGIASATRRTEPRSGATN